jgi:hypothetical protein
MTRACSSVEWLIPLVCLSVCARSTCNSIKYDHCFCHESYNEITFFWGCKSDSISSMGVSGCTYNDCGISLGLLDDTYPSTKCLLNCE